MRNKLRNGVMLAVLAVAMIACGSGSGSSNSQPKPINIQLPEPEISADGVLGDVNTYVPFVKSLKPFATSLLGFIPGIGTAFDVMDSASALFSLFDSSIGLSQIDNELAGITSQVNQIESQMQIQLSLSATIIGDVQSFESLYELNQMQGEFEAIKTTFANINTIYGAYNHEHVLGDVKYSSSVVNDLFTYAESMCQNQQTVNELSNFNTNSAAYSTVFIDYYGADGSFWSTFMENQSAYISGVLGSGGIPAIDIVSFMNTYNYKLFMATTVLYAAWDEMRLMQLAQAAYYYACPQAVRAQPHHTLTDDFLQNFNSPTIEDLSVLESMSNGDDRRKLYLTVAESISYYYSRSFYEPGGLRDTISTHLQQPFTNQSIESYVNNRLFTHIGTPKLFAQGLFGELSGGVGGLPNTLNSCSPTSFYLQESMAYLSAMCLVESNSMGLAYHNVSHEIPYSSSITGSGVEVESTFGYANLYYDESKQTIKSSTTSLSIPVSSTSTGFISDYGSSPTSMVKVWYKGIGVNTSVTIESNIYVFGSPWTNFNHDSNSCGTNADGNAMCAGADFLMQYPVGYNVAFTLSLMAFYSTDGTANTQAYYYASYKGHLFLIQYVANGDYIKKSPCLLCHDLYGAAPSMYMAMHCLNNDTRCNESMPSNAPFLQRLHWTDGTEIRLSQNSIESIIIQAISPSNTVTRKLFQFESDSQLTNWMSNPKTYPYKAYLNGKISYSLNSTSQTVIFVSKNYVSGSYYQLVYTPNSESSLVIQNCANGSCTNTQVLVNAPNGATNLYLTHGDMQLVNGNNVVWSISDQYHNNNTLWFPNIYAEVLLTDNGQLNAYSYDTSNQYGISGTSPDDSNYTRMLWSSSNFPWQNVNHGNLLQPAGSYTTSCSVTSWDSPILTASCANNTSSAQTNVTTLNYMKCGKGSTVSNANGVLTCDTLNKSTKLVS